MAAILRTGRRRMEWCVGIAPHARHTATTMKSKRSLLILGIAAAWYVAVVLLSILMPPHDTVTVGTDTTLKPPSVTSVKLTCNSLFSSTAIDSLPALKILPAGVKPLAYTGAPCDGPQHDARSIFFFDTVVFVLIGAGVVGWNVRLRRIGDGSTELAAA